MSTILIIVLLILLLGGGGYYGHSRYGGSGLGGVLGLILVVAVVVWLVGGCTWADRPPAGRDILDETGRW
jgi:Protein of unknown function (DUF3309)